MAKNEIKLELNQAQYNLLTGDRFFENIVGLTTVEIENQIYERIKSRYGSGKLYKRKGRTHVASSPGQPPTVDYGNLIKGLNIDRVSSEEFLLVIPGISLILENGTSKMRARPFIKPSIQAAFKSWGRILPYYFKQVLETNRTMMQIALGMRRR